MRWRTNLAVRAAAMLLALAVCFGMLPRPAFAADGGGTDGIPEKSADAGDAVTVRNDGHLGVLVKRTAAKAARVGVLDASFDWDGGTEQQARYLMRNMSEEEKVGQLFLLHWPGSAKQESCIKSYQPGGFILFGDAFNGGATPDSVKAEIAAAQGASSIPLIISTDEEGGNVCRVSGNVNFRAEKFLGPQDLKKDGIQAVRTQAAEMAGLLKGLGINMDHAPVADTSVSNGYIYGRTWGGTYLENAEYVSAAVETLESNGMGTSMKHFPGYGDSADDTHGGIVVDDRDEETLDRYLVPFAAGVAAGGLAVMVTHNQINVLDNQKPASLSEKTYELLRDQMGFKGLAITDDLGMEAVKKFVGSGNASLMALRAGADMVVTDKTSEIQGVVDAAKGDASFMARVDEACARVLCWKIAHGLVPDGSIPDEAAYTPTGGTEPTEYGAFKDMWDKAVAGSGTVSLLKDVEFAIPLVLNTGKSVTLDLLGHELKYIGTGNKNTSVISVTDSSTFALVDSSADGIAERYIRDVSGTVSEYDKDGKVFRYTKTVTDDNGVVHQEYEVDFSRMASFVSDVAVGFLLTGTNSNLVMQNVLLSDPNGNQPLRMNWRCPTTISNCAIVDSGNGTANEGSILLNTFANSEIVIEGSYILGNRAKVGGGIWMSTSTARSIKLRIKDSVIACNSSTSDGGGVYFGNVPSSELTLAGKVLIRDNKAGGNGNNLYLSEGKTVTLSEDFNGGSEIHVHTASSDDEINVAVHDGVSGADAAAFVPEREGYLSMAKDGHVKFLTAVSVDIPVMVSIDGKAVQAGTVTSMYMDPDGTGRIRLDEVSGMIEKYGFDPVKYQGESVFGFRGKSSSGDIGALTAGPVNGENGWTIQVPDDMIDQGCLFYLSKELDSGSSSPESVGFWSVTVRDVYGAMNGAGMFETRYVPDGGGTKLDLPGSDDYAWEFNSGDYRHSESESGGRLLVDISSVHAPVVLSRGTELGSVYTAQYYANMKSFLKKKDYSAGVKAALDVIDTTGGKLPANGVLGDDMPTMKLYLDEDGNVLMSDSMERLYADRMIVYDASTSVMNMDELATDGHYELKELWVLKEGGQPDSTDRADWDVYDRDNGLGNLKFTSNQDAVNANTIYLRDGAVVRFVYDPTSGSRSISSRMYDYDITDGKFYSDHGCTTETERGGNTTVYVDSKEKGINSPGNYTGDGAKFAFGNANTGTGLDTQQISEEDMYFNRANKNSSNSELGYAGCYFGLVTGLDGDGLPVYKPGLAVPELFGDGDASGKNRIDGTSLKFKRDGDTYTLDGVTGPDGDDWTGSLSKFGHPGIWDGTNGNKSIWTNDFWPMDHSDAGHDVMFGDPKTTKDIKLGHLLDSNKNEEYFPENDDGKNHNSYFGLDFALTFAMPADYRGELEYCFFGDDDMWVFLDGRLVCDIGGVHSSVGEYVNLWDYIEPGDTSEHELKVFYTERGASGSTCWMQFTIPNAQFRPVDQDDAYGSLSISKAVVNPEGHENDRYEFTVGLTLTGSEGVVLGDEFSYSVTKADGTVTNGLLGGNGGIIRLSGGDVATVRGIPAGTRFQVTEGTYDGCSTTVSVGNAEATDERAVDGTIGTNTTVELNYVNTYEKITSDFEFPKTGGTGTDGIVLAGCVLALLSGCAFMRRRRRIS